METLLFLLLPVLDIITKRICWKINKGLFIDLFIPKEDREKIWGVFEKDENIID